jgi:hypothetical protein
MYFKTVNSRNWVFYGKYGDKELLLYDIRNTPIHRHVMVKDANPYLPQDAEYFEKAFHTVHGVFSRLLATAVARTIT